MSPKFWLQPLGRALGKNEVNVAEMVASHGEVREGFLLRTGFTSVFHVEGETSGLDLALQALEGIDKTWLNEHVDTLIYLTSTGNRNAPGNGHLLHGALGLAPQTLVIDLNDACTGFIRSLILSESLIHTGRSKCILVVLSDTYSKLYEESNLKVSPLFSDGASAALISKELHDVPGATFLPRKWEVLGTSIASEGSLANELTVSSGSSTFPMGELEMNGAGVFNFVVKHLKNTVDQALSEATLPHSEVSKWFVHQGSRAVVEAVSKTLDLDADEQFAAKSYGNVVGSAIPFQLMDEDLSHTEPETKIFLVAFGVGLTITGIVLSQEILKR